MTTIAVTIPSNSEAPKPLTPAAAPVCFKEDVQRCFQLLSDVLGRRVEGVVCNPDGRIYYKMGGNDCLDDSKEAAKIARYMLDRRFTKPLEMAPPSNASIVSEIVSMVGNISSICRNSFSLTLLTAAVTFLGVLAFPLTLISILFLLNNGGVTLAKAEGNGAPEQVDVEGARQAMLKIIFGGMFVSLAIGVGLLYIPALIATTSFTAALAVAGLFSVGIAGLIGYAALAIGAIYGLVKVNLFREGFLATLKIVDAEPENENRDLVKAQRGLQFLKYQYEVEGKVDEKRWKIFERRVGAELAEKVRKEIPVLEAKLEGKDPIALEFAKQLIDQVDRESLQIKVSHVCRLVIALVGIVSMILLLMANPIATPLFIVAAVLWCTVDSSHVNRAIGSLSYAIFRKNKIWKDGAFADVDKAIQERAERLKEQKKSAQKSPLKIA
jgi:hypothetical protein